MTTGASWLHRTRISRRNLIRSGSVAGLGIVGAALIGCSSADEAATPGTGASGTPSGTPVEEIVSTATASDIQYGGTLRLSGAEPPTLDPYRNAAVTTKTRAAFIYSRLFKQGTEDGVDPFDLAPVPDVAESMETEDGMTWVVRLKPGVRFHNIAPVSGRELTTEDVLFSWNRLTAETGPNRTQVAEVTDLQAVDDYTLRFSTAAPSTTFPELIADANLLLIQPTEADGGFDPSLQPIGSGPFMSGEHQVDVRHLLPKHPDYHEERLPYLDAVEQVVIAEYANTKAQFEAGGIHSFAVQPDDVLELRNRFPEVQWLRGTGIGMAWIAFSGEDMDPDAVWRDARFRQGVSMLLDRDAINELAGNTSALRQAGLNAVNNWNNAIPGAFGRRFWLDPRSPEMGELGTYFQYDPQAARQLFDAVGLPDEPLPFEYTSGYSANFQRVAQVHGNFLSEGGLNLDTRTTDYSSHYINRTFLGDFHGIVYGIESTLTPSGYVERLFGADPANHGRVRDAVIDDLHQRQQRELDPEARTELFYQIQKRNAEEMFYVPTEHSNPGGGAWTAYQGEVRGLRRTRGYGAGTETYPYQWLLS